MAGVSDLAGMVPGFDFLQGLFKSASASAGMPHMGQWVAPTLDPEELDKRISELRTVQFWLEQNAKLLGTTIQGLEVQRMTLSTLQTLNLPLADLGEALKIRVPSPPPPAPPPPRAPAPAPVEAAPEAESARAESSSAPAGVDPVEWWGSLTQQFTELAAKAVQDSTADTAKAMAAAATATAATATSTATPAKPKREPAAKTPRKAAAKRPKRPKAGAAPAARKKSA